MTKPRDDSQNWTDNARNALRQSERQVPEQVAERLAITRRSAIASASAADQKKSAGWPTLLGTGALASAALLLVLVLPRLGTDTLPLLDETEMAAAHDAELLEDLEFVAWMLAEETTDNALGQG